MNLKRSLSFALAALSAIAAAWNGNGHQQVADLAWVKLTHESKLEIAKILASGDSVTRGERTNDYSIPAPAGPISDEYLEKVVRPAFRKAATWADDIKGGQSAQYDAKIDADNAASPGVHPPEGDTHRARGEDVRCKSWHYYDDPINAPGDKAAHAARDSNAVRALGIVRASLEDQEKGATPSRKEQLYDLFWIEHLFGDLVQPLHCSESYVLKPTGDAGGNGFLTMAPNTFRPGEPENLHSYWDAGIDHAIAADATLAAGADIEKVTAAWTADANAAPSDQAVQDLDPMSWVHTGHDLAVKFVYGGIQPMGVPDEAYQKNQNDLCKKQAILAGARMATYLNSVLKSRP